MIYCVSILTLRHASARFFIDYEVTHCATKWRNGYRLIAFLRAPCACVFFAVKLLSTEVTAIIKTIPKLYALRPDATGRYFL